MLERPQAVSSSRKLAFIAASCATVFSPYVGDAERFIRELFVRGRQAAPAVIFLDEIDTLVVDRATASGKDHFQQRECLRQKLTPTLCCVCLYMNLFADEGVAARVLSTLLNELDGIEATGDVLLLVCSSSHLSFPSPHSNTRYFL